MVRTRSRVSWLALMAALPGIIGCGDEHASCGPGTEALGSTCVPACGTGTERDASGACVPSCVEGMHRDPGTGACLPNGQRCPSGQMWVDEVGRCVDLREICANGTTWVSSQARCVAEDRLRVPDLIEGTAPNDLVPPPPWTCERFPVPAIGGSTSFAGRVDDPRDEYPGALAPDLDCWLFETDGPTILRFFVDGIGGTAPAFKLVRLDSVLYVDRIGIGTTSSAVTRDVYLPAEGTYAAIVTDAMNLWSTAGMMHGGEGFGYYTEVTRLPLPGPIRLEPDPHGFFSASGTLTRSPPEEGTSVVLLEVPVAANSLHMLDLETDVGGVNPLLAGITPRGSTFEGDYLHMPFPTATGEDGMLLLGIDFERWYAPGDANWRLSLEPRPLRLVSGETGPLSFVQEPWAPPVPMQSHYLGMTAEAGDIVELRFGSSSGFTCFNVWTDGFDSFVGDRGCWVGAEPFHQDELWFQAAYSGLYVISISDYSEGDVFGRSLLSVPRHDFEVAVGAYPQAPIELGDLSSPWSGRESISTEVWQRIYRLAPDAGDAFWFEIAGEGTFDPYPVFYGTDSLTLGIHHDWSPEATAFAFRSERGATELIGIGDWERRPGAFRLDARRIAVRNLGSLTPESSIEVEERITLDQPRRFFAFEALKPGRLTFTATPPPGLDLALIPHDRRFGQDWNLNRNDVGPGEEERLELLIPSGSFWIQVASNGDEPLPEETTFRVEATIQGVFEESEPNDFEHPDDFPIPGVMAGECEAENGSDWYLLLTTEPIRANFRFHELGVGGYTTGGLVLFDLQGNVLAESYGSTWDVLPELYDIRLEAGSHYLLVNADGDDRRYAIEVTDASR